MAAIHLRAPAALLQPEAARQRVLQGLQPELQPERPPEVPGEQRQVLLYQPVALYHRSERAYQQRDDLKPDVILQVGLAE